MRNYDVTICQVRLFIKQQDDCQLLSAEKCLLKDFLQIVYITEAGFCNSDARVIRNSQPWEKTNNPNPVANKKRTIEL